MTTNQCNNGYTGCTRTRPHVHNNDGSMFVANHGAFNEQSLYDAESLAAQAGLGAIAGAIRAGGLLGKTPPTAAMIASARDAEAKRMKAARHESTQDHKREITDDRWPSDHTVAERNDAIMRAAQLTAQLEDAHDQIAGLSEAMKERNPLNITIQHFNGVAAYVVVHGTRAQRDAFVKHGGDRCPELRGLRVFTADEIAIQDGRNQDRAMDLADKLAVSEDRLRTVEIMNADQSAYIDRLRSFIGPTALKRLEKLPR